MLFLGYPLIKKVRLAYLFFPHRQFLIPRKDDTMPQLTNISRLLLALGNKQYLTEEQYSVLLEENGLNPTESYISNTQTKYSLLKTQLDILNTLANNIDLFRSIETEFSNTSEAYTALFERIAKIEKEIASTTFYEAPANQITYLYHN